MPALQRISPCLWFDQPDAFRRSASHYVAKILEGGPVDLPVQRPEKFQFIINTKTARALGLPTTAVDPRARG